jgi:hypothetical protein
VDYRHLTGVVAFPVLLAEWVVAWAVSVWGVRWILIPLPVGEVLQITIAAAVIFLVLNGLSSWMQRRRRRA